MAAYFSDNSDAMVQLESMVDTAGLRNVLFALAYICNAKAEHVSTNWQDQFQAKTWEQRAGRIDKFANSIRCMPWEDLPAIRQTADF